MSLNVNDRGTHALQKFNNDIIIILSNIRLPVI